MDVQVAVKNIKYDFGKHSTFFSVQSIAEQTIFDLYNEEKAFQNEEFAAMLADGDVNNYKEYCDEVGIHPSDVDYRKSFLENLTHPQIQKQIKELTNQYMCNVCDLPKNAVVSINTSMLNSDGKPDNAEVLAVLQEKIGAVASVTGFDSADEAEKKDILSQNAYEKVGEMIKSNDFKSYLDLRASIGKYSSNNISLIYCQEPNAKAVMGYNAWRRLERHLKVGAGKNEISIWCPCKRELKTEQQVEDYIKNSSHQYGEIDSEKAQKVKARMLAEIEKNGAIEVCVGFRLGTVYDISQTAPNNHMHDNAMDIINLNKPLSKDMKNYDEVVKSLKEAATLAPLNILQDLSQQDGLFEAIAAYADNLLTVSPDKVRGIKSTDSFKGDMHTIETAMSAYLICSHIGIECADKAGLRLAEIFNNKELTEQSIKFGKREMFLKSFDRACCVADQFNKAFDKSFGYDLEAQREAIVKQAEERRAQEEAERKAKALNRIYFGKTPMQKYDVWEKDGEKYIIAQNEENNAFYVKILLNTKHLSFKYLRNDEGKIKRFDTPPSRETVEKLYAQQSIETELKSDPYLSHNDAVMSAKFITELKNKSKQSGGREI